MSPGWNVFLSEDRVMQMKIPGYGSYAFCIFMFLMVVLASIWGFTHDQRGVGYLMIVVAVGILIVLGSYIRERHWKTGFVREIQEKHVPELAAISHDIQTKM